MSKITLFDKTFRPFIPNEELEKAIDKVADHINADFSDSKEPVVLLCISFDCQLVSMKLSSYCGTESTGNVKQVMGMTGNIEGKHVIIVEDIVDTGNTIVDLTRIVKEKGALDCKVCTMLLKPEVYKKDVKLDYVAMEIPNKFIVGFGLDYNELGRNYKDIYILDED